MVSSFVGVFMIVGLCQLTMAQYYGGGGGNNGYNNGGGGNGCGTCPCPDFYNPVCGSDGQTYQNKCQLKCAQKCNSYISESYQGACGGGNGGGYTTPQVEIQYKPKPTKTQSFGYY